jgi:putative ABC transport system permease protein
MRDLNTAVFIAYKSITKGSKSTLVLLVFILALSFLEMMFVSGVLSGMTYSQVRALRNFLSSDINISPQEQPQLKQYIPNQGQLRAQIETIPGVIATARHYNMAGSLSFDKDKNGQFKIVSGAIIGTDPGVEDKVLAFGQLMIAGRSLAADDTDQIVLSSSLAGGYGAIARQGSDLGGVKVGDKLIITYSNRNMRTYTVKGIYNDVMGLAETFITSKEAESILSIHDSASHILVKADISRVPVTDYESKIKALAPNLKIQNYNDLLGSFASFLQALNLIQLIVTSISVAVVAITIFVLIYVNAVTKRRQIGILKAIGIKKSIIVNAYIIQSLFYTACGIGIGMFLVFGVVQPFLTFHPIPLVVGLLNLVLVYSPLRVGLSVVAFFVAGFFAGRIPANLVARQDILKAIWG